MHDQLNFMRSVTHACFGFYIQSQPECVFNVQISFSLSLQPVQMLKIDLVIVMLWIIECCFVAVALAGACPGSLSINWPSGLPPPPTSDSQIYADITVGQEVNVEGKRVHPTLNLI